MNQHGNMAVGVSGTDAGVIVAHQASERLGRVGEITDINSALISDLVAADYIPVIASIAIGEDGGCYNVNADVAAGHIAAAIGAHKIIFLTDVDGLFENYPDCDSLIANMTVEEARAMVEERSVSTGMIPKLSSCLTALDAGVMRAHIVNGTIPPCAAARASHRQGHRDDDHAPEPSRSFNVTPLGNFAAKLIESRE